MWKVRRACRPFRWSESRSICLYCLKTAVGQGGGGFSFPSDSHQSAEQASFVDLLADLLLLGVSGGVTGLSRVVPWCRLCALFGFAFSSISLGLTVVFRLASSVGFGLLSDGMVRSRTAFSLKPVASVHHVRFDFVCLDFVSSGFLRLCSLLTSFAGDAPRLGVNEASASRSSLPHIGFKVWLVFGSNLSLCVSKSLVFWGKHFSIGIFCSWSVAELLGEWFLVASQDLLSHHMHFCPFMRLR